MRWIRRPSRACSGARLRQRLRHVVADVRDYERLAAEVQAAQPSAIFHLAAQPLVRRAYAEPRETFETNVMGTVNVLEAARACSSVRAVVIVTSDKCYQNQERTRHTARRTRWVAAIPTAPARAARNSSPQPTATASSPTWLSWPPSGRQRDRRGRLGRRPDHPGLLPSAGGGEPNRRPKPGCRPALAARARAAVRVPLARGSHAARWPPLRGHLELRTRRPRPGPAGALGGRALPGGVGRWVLDHPSQCWASAP